MGILNNMKKIAIQGDEANGQKIINYFMSLGAINSNKCNGRSNWYYHINQNKIIECKPLRDIIDYEVYKSWKDFENNYLNKSKMEERTIKISLEKAIEWYKQGGDLKEVALQAFSEEELKDKVFPKSWNEYNTKACYNDNRFNAGSIPGSADYCHFATKEEAEAFVALGKLIQLRNEYWRLDNNWQPNWSNRDMKFAIGYENNKIARDCFHFNSQILVFRTAELRDKFYENFKDLIEEAKMFL